MIVFQKGGPLGKPEIGCNQGRFLLVPFVHQGKKQPDLYRLDLHISQFVDYKTIGGGKGFGLIAD